MRLLRRRRSATALLAAGMACLLASGFGLALGAGPARAAGEPGSGFETFALSAEANGVRVLGPDPNLVGNISHALSTFRSGPVGYGLATIAWPGPVGGNLGSLLLLLGNPACSPPDERIPPPPTCPPLPEDVVSALNYPVRAEARTGSDPSAFDDVPGVRMSADVTDTTVVADAVVGAAEAEALGVGSARSTSTTTLTGPASAVAEATSRVTDFSIADGTFLVRSITSTARATTDSVKAEASGTTTVTGATIAGVPVTIDRDGVHVQEGTLPADQAVAGVNQAIEAFGMRITVSDPILTQDGGAVSYSAGSVVFSWIAPPNEEQIQNGEPGQHVVTVTVGGATVGAAADAASPLDFGDFTPPDLGTGPAGTGYRGGDLPDQGVAAAPPVSPPAITRTTPAAVRLAGDIGIGWIALAVAGAVLIGTGAYRLPERLLAESGISCDLEEGT